MSEFTWPALDVKSVPGCVACVSQARGFDPETFEIIGAAMEVHRTWGPGYLEAVYHKSLLYELEMRGIEAATQVPFPLAYKGRDLGTCYRADLVVGNVLVELKAHSGLGEADFAQALHYMRSSRLRKGLLINFGLRSLQHRRLVLDNDIRENPC